MKALVLIFVLLAATAVQAEDRNKCIRDLYELTGNMAQAKRSCDPKNQVTNPNEYGWVCYEGGYAREKGTGMKQKKDALCE